MDFSDNDRVFIGGLDLRVCDLDRLDHDEGARSCDVILADGRKISGVDR